MPHSKLTNVQMETLREFSAFLGAPQAQEHKLYGSLEDALYDPLSVITLFAEPSPYSTEQVDFALFAQPVAGEGILYYERSYCTVSTPLYNSLKYGWPVSAEYSSSDSDLEIEPGGSGEWGIPNGCGASWE